MNLTESPELPNPKSAMPYTRKVVKILAIFTLATHALVFTADRFWPWEPAEELRRSRAATDFVYPLTSNDTGHEKVRTYLYFSKSFSHFEILEVRQNKGEAVVIGKARDPAQPFYMDLFFLLCIAAVYYWEKKGYIRPQTV